MATDSYVSTAFTVLIDTAEGNPWTFDGLFADADRKDLPLVVRKEFACLGRYPNSNGDYSIAGLVGRVAVERKSLDDAISTVLGWTSGYESQREIDGRRDRFRSELANLHRIDRSPRGSACVVVESTLEECLRRMPGCDGEDYFNERTGEINATRGKKSVRENRKIFLRSYESWTQVPRLSEPDLRVQWKFYESRRSAEIAAFRWLEKYWEHQSKAEQRAALERVQQGRLEAA